MKTLFDEETEGSMQDSVRMVAWEVPGSNILLELPEGLKDMDEERKKEWYPYENRPKVILEDGNRNIQMTFQLMDKELKEEDTYGAIQEISKLMEDAFPKYGRTPVYLFESGTVPVGWFLIRMEDRAIEHVKVVFSSEERLVLFTVTYPEAEKMKWRVLTKHIFASVRRKEQENGTSSK